MIALGCDHGGYELMQEVKAYLDKQGLEYQDFGCYTSFAFSCSKASCVEPMPSGNMSLT